MSENTMKVIGLGPGSMKFLTMEAYKEILNADEIYVRTLKHPVIDELVKEGANFTSYDEYYEKYDTFDEVYENIAADIIKKAKNKKIFYAVPGNPFVAERTVELIAEAQQNQGLQVEYIHGTSFIDAIITCLGRDPVKGLNVIDGLKIEKSDIINSVDNMIIQVYDNIIASNVKISLMNHYDDDHEVIIIRGAGIPGEEVVEYVPLYDMDRLDIYDHLTSIYVPLLPESSDKRYTLPNLIRIMEKLRGVDGCPWDKEQTHETLKKCLVEEAYEVVDAINNDDLFALEEELGDILLQVVFHSEIAKENGYFNMSDVIMGITSKMINRHPHVFSNEICENSVRVLENWERIKQEEKNISSTTENMKCVPLSFPSNLRAYKVQKKAAEVGFDWDSVNGAIDKVYEELEEFKVALKNRDTVEIEKELGDTLFSVINICRFAKVDPELALNMTTNKFIDRFSFIEESEAAKNAGISNLSLEEMEKLWEEAKKR